MDPVLTLDYSNGSLPPPYAYTYKISFFETGYAQVEFFSSDNGDLKPIKTENRPFNLEDLRKQVAELDAHSSQKTNVRVGGELRVITFEKDGKNQTITIYTDDNSQRAAYNKLLMIFDPEFEKTQNKIIENNTNQ